MEEAVNQARDGSTDQKIVWSGAGGQGWVKAQALLDQMLQPLEELLTEAASETSARSVLDVGCGTGATTVAVARRLGATARCLGVDLSQDMVEAARARAKRDGVSASFACSDVQTYPFEPDSIDLIISRFGVMFFEDPVQAFANLRAAASSSADLRLLTWRSAAENPFMTEAEKAAEPFLPGVSKRMSNEPGQFGFAEPARVRKILTESGWDEIDIEPIDVPCAFSASDLDLYLTCLGPVGRALKSVDQDTQARVLEAVRPAFDPYLHDAEIRFTAACWMISASAASQGVRGER